MYQYDKVGNQIFTTQNGINEYREVNLENQYTEITNTNIEYDLKGNIISYKDKEFEYDYLNRLVELKKDNITIATYTYDAQNRRVSKTVNSNTTRYIYNNNQVVQEYENDSLTNTYIYASYIDDPVAYTFNNETYYYIKDRQYSIQAVTNSIGDIVESYSYNSFGIITIKDQNQNVILKSNVNNSITYTGRRYDQESELYYYRNRMYSPTLGRFMSNDPKGYVDGMNLYSYVKNNPLKYLDAMGTTATTMTQSQMQYSQNISSEREEMWNDVSKFGNEVYNSSVTGIKTLNSYSSATASVLNIGAVDNEILVVPALIADSFTLGTEVILLGLGEKGEIASLVNSINGAAVDNINPKTKYGMVSSIILKESIKMEDNEK